MLGGLVDGAITDTLDFALGWPVRDPAHLPLREIQAYTSLWRPQVACPNLIHSCSIQLRHGEKTGPAAGSNTAAWQSPETTFPKVKRSRMHHSHLGAGTIGVCSRNAVEDAANSVSLASGSERGQPFTDMARDRGWVRKGVESDRIPPEIMVMIAKQILVAEPRCILGLIVPDWCICKSQTPDLGKPSGAPRVVTYIRGTGGRAGTLLYTFEHGDQDHILAPMADFDPNAVAVSLKFSGEYTREFYRGHTHVFTLRTWDRPSTTTEEVVGSRRESGRGWNHRQPLCSQRPEVTLPFDDEPGAETGPGPTPGPIYRYIRYLAVHSPPKPVQASAGGGGNGGSVEKAGDVGVFDPMLDRDRSAHLWLSWSQMPRLESVFLDLRIYSHDINTDRRCLSKFQIVERAQEMGRHLQLKMLVLAGLQSYSFHTTYEGMEVRDLEHRDEVGGDPNWIRIFRPAIREGGKIVLVDKLTDSVSA